MESSPDRKGQKLEAKQESFLELQLCDINEQPEEEQPDDQRDNAKMRSCFAEMLNSQFKDIKIVCEDVEVYAHKSVLLRIPYFKDALTYDPTMSSIEVQGAFSPDALHLIIQHAYFMQPKVTVRNAQPLLEAAAFFLIDDLWTFCDKFIANRIVLTVENCLEVQGYAVAQSAKLLAKKTDRFIREHCGAVGNTDAIKFISQNEIESFLSMKDLETLPNEEIFWEALVKWVEADAENRKSLVPKLLKLLRLPCLSIDAITRKVLSHPYIDIDPECRQAVEDMLLYKGNPNDAEIQQKCEAALGLEQRCKYPRQIYYFAQSIDGTSNRVLVLQSPDGVWMQKCWNGFPGRDDAYVDDIIAVKENLLYYEISDGADSLGDPMYSYDFVTESWSVIEGDDGRPDFSEVMLCSVGGKLVACSDIDLYNGEMEVWSYDPGTNSWDQKTFIGANGEDADERSCCCGVTSRNFNDGKDVLCILSEYSEHRVLLYDVDTGKLIKRGTLPHNGTEYGSMVSGYDGKVFIAFRSVINMYDVVQDEWSTLPDLNVERFGFDLVVAFNRLYAIGGREERFPDKELLAVEYIDLTDSTSHWQHGPTLMEHYRSSEFAVFC